MSREAVGAASVAWLETGGVPGAASVTRGHAAPFAHAHGQHEQPRCRMPYPPSPSDAPPDEPPEALPSNAGAPTRTRSADVPQRGQPAGSSRSAMRRTASKVPHSAHS